MGRAPTQVEDELGQHKQRREEKTPSSHDWTMPMKRMTEGWALLYNVGPR